MKTQCLLLVLILLGLVVTVDPTLMSINREKRSHTVTVLFDNESNASKIKLTTQSSETNQLGLFVDCSNNDFIINIDNETAKRSLNSFKRSVLMVLTDDNKDEVALALKKTNSLELEIEMLSSKEHNSCTLTFFLNDPNFEGIPFDTESVVYLFGKTGRLHLNFQYKKAIESLYKLRFQTNVIDNHDDYSLSATLQTPKGRSFQLNNYFENTLGGVLSKEIDQLCTQDCIYALDFSFSGLSSFVVEAYQLSDLIRVRANHSFPYYDRAYIANEVIRYEFILPSNFDFSNNVVINLIPVSSEVNLFVNPGFVPNDINLSNWKVTGFNAKRLVISGADIRSIRAGRVLYVTVVGKSPGEFLLKLEIFPERFSGVIELGTIEVGTVHPANPVHYLYRRYINSTENVFFQIIVNVVSGNVDLMSKKCSNEDDCVIQSNDSDDSYKTRVSNKELYKNMLVSQTCEHVDDRSLCLIAIKVEAVGDQPAIYNISLMNENTPHIMSLGVPLSVDIKHESYFNFKCSVSGVKSSEPLNLEITHFFGSFDLFFSGSESFPRQDSNEGHWSFQNKSGIDFLNKVQNLEIVSEHGSPNGIYYFTVHSSLLTRLSLKLTHKDVNVRPLLTSGRSERVLLDNNHAFAQFVIQLPSELETIQVNFSPIRGQALLIASYGDIAPLREKNDFSSSNNVIVVPGGHKSTLVVEVLRSESMHFSGELEGHLSYVITSTWQIKLNTGIIQSANLSPKAFFFIDLLDQNKSLTILKYSADDYNVTACLTSSQAEPKCLYLIEGRESALFISGVQLDSLRKNLGCSGPVCQVKLVVMGSNGVKVSLGYTVDDLFFEAPHGEAILGPKICHKERPMHFVFKSLKSDSTIYFKSKDPSTRVLSKIIRLSENLDTAFPDSNDFDRTVQERFGPVTLIRYPAETISAMGHDFVIFVSVISTNECKEGEDRQTGFHLQMTTHNIEIPKHESVTVNTEEALWSNFSFFYDGNGDSPVVNVTSGDSIECSIKLFSGLYPGPPFRVSPLFEVDTPLPFQLKSRIDRAGHYTVSVLTSVSSKITIKWADRTSFDFVEVFNELPMTMTVRPGRPYYFSVYIPSVRDERLFKIFVDSNNSASLGLTKAKKVLEVPDKKDQLWGLSMSPVGGSFALEVPTSDKNFCSDCTLLGFIESDEGAEVTLLSVFQSPDDYLDLPSNLTIHDDLDSDQSVYFRIPCVDKEPVDISVSIHVGSVEVFVATADKPKPGPSNNINRQTLNADSDKHRFVSIGSHYLDSGAHEFYFAVKNTHRNRSRFGVTIYKNGRPSQIIGGVAREIYLGPLSQSSLYYKPDVNNTKSELEVVFALKQVIAVDLIPSILAQLPNYFQVSGVDLSNNVVPVSVVSSEMTNNTVFLKLSVSASLLSKVVIAVNNKSATAILLSIEIHDGEYRFLPLEENLVRKIGGGNSMFLEVYGQKSASLLLDLEVCSGELDMSIHLSDIEESTQGQRFDEVSKISSDKKNKMSLSSEIYKSVEMSKDRVFIKIQNVLEDRPSYFSLGAFHPKNAVLDNHTQLDIGDKGRVRLEIDRNRVVFHGISFDTTYGDNFYHRIRYVLYISDSFKVLRHLHNCGETYLKEAFPSAVYHKRESVFEFRDVSSRSVEMFIGLPKMDVGQKHHGTLLAFVEIYSDDAGVLSPLRTRKIAYDDFMLDPPKLQMNLLLVVTTLIIISVFGAISYLVKAYVFGNIGKINNYRKVEDFTKYDENVNSQIINSILVKEEEEMPVVSNKHPDLRQRPLDKDIVINTLVAELSTTNK